ncbi:MAG: multicopper oxidase family protein [Candidatus Lustribacter sp.]|jgi:FtsP/CotA-like multicopper oxidase with cupredoxin domain
MRYVALPFAAAVLTLGLVACGGGGGSTTPPAAAAASPAGGGPAPLNTIPEVDSVNGVATLSLTAQFDANSRPAFFWQGQEVAPTIRVHPGDTIQLTFTNSLPEYCAVGVVSNSNLHFHGLTSSPNAPGDDVIDTNAAPGTAVNYTVAINPDQPPGMYWYHAHPHGLSSWEVGNGMAGVIIVEGIGNAVPQTAGLRERVIILGDVPNSSTFAAGEESVLRRSTAARRGVQDADESPLGGDACAPETDATPMINGATMAAIGIKPGETELLRVLNASGHRHFDIAVDGQQLQLVAQDGVPINTYPGAPTTLPVSDVVIPPAGRAEFLVTGGTTPAALISKCYQSGPAGDNNPEVALGVLENDSSWPNPSTATTTATKRVAKVASLRYSQYYHSMMPAPAQERLIHFTEDANGFYINGQAYSPTAAPQIVAQSGTTEEWTLENDTQEVHSFHIHQVHFVVESINGVPQPNEHWLDTYDIPPEGVGVTGQLIPSLTKVLLDFRDPTIRGTFLFHCHILDHEDGGMMAKVQVL